MHQGHHKQLEASYQRGLLLGFTMAEIVTLIIFVLMLVLSALLVKQDKAKAETERAGKEYAVRLAVILEKIKADGYEENQIENILKELKFAKQQKQELTETKAKLAKIEHQKELDKALLIAREHEIELAKINAEEREIELAKIKDELAKLPEIIKDKDAWDLIAQQVINQKVDLPKTSVDQREAIKNYVLNAMHFQDKLQSYLREKKLDTDKIMSYFENLQKNLHEQERDIANLRGQNKNLLDRLGSSGKGTEKPPCWATESGGPEYIFDIQLTSAGLIIKDNALPHRIEDQTKLPLSGISFMRTLPPNEFRSRTKDILNWSNTHECRFFVRVYDNTGSSEKNVYKRMLRTAGEHFYYFESTN